MKKKILCQDDKQETREASATRRPATYTTGLIGGHGRRGGTQQSRYQKNVVEERGITHEAKFTLCNEKDTKTKRILAGGGTKNGGEKGKAEGDERPSKKRSGEEVYRTGGKRAGYSYRNLCTDGNTSNKKKLEKGGQASWPRTAKGSEIKKKQQKMSNEDQKREHELLNGVSPSLKLDCMAES